MTNRDLLVKLIRSGATLLADFAYGIDAGNAIRHGLPVPPRRGNAGRPAAPGSPRYRGHCTHPVSTAHTAGPV
jgi:hypothetical protein